MGEFYIIILYGLPLIGITYMLIKLLLKHLVYFKEKKTDKHLRLKIGFLFIGIFYSLLLFIGLVLTVYRPIWFKPPNWLIIAFIVAFVPYLGCVLGFWGLGYMGHSGKSPSKVISGAIKEIKNEYEKKA